MADRAKHYSMNFSLFRCILHGICDPTGRWSLGWLTGVNGLSQCLEWSKKEAGSLPQAEVECPSPEFLKFIFDLKMASFDALLVVFYAI